MMRKQTSSTKLFLIVKIKYCLHHSQSIVLPKVESAGVRPLVRFFQVQQLHLRQTVSESKLLETVC